MNPIYSILIAFCMVLPTSFIVDGGSEKAQKYIEKYKGIAISEMHRTGIPASIKLAQGLLESSWGQSELAIHANNHFGIKCGKSWQGPTHFVYDDDYEYGKKVKSCFRAFGSPVESYREHSEFLSNPKKERYALLFYFGPKDYKSWAYGLKDAGYATDPKYPQKLIKIIEQYELYKFDGGTLIEEQEVVVNESNYELQEHKKTKQKSIQPRAEGSHKTVMITEQGGNNHPPLFSQNKKAEETKSTTTRRSSTPTVRKKKSTQSKRTKQSTRSRTAPEYHYVSQGETMKTIARRYSIPTLLLYSKNRMPLGTEPLPGEKIQLKGTVRIGDRPEFAYPEKRKSGEFVF